MQAEALEIVQKVVMAGDAGEKVVDLGGALFAGRIKRITHKRESNGVDKTRQSARK